MEGFCRQFGAVGLKREACSEICVNCWFLNNPKEIAVPQFYLQYSLISTLH